MTKSLDKDTLARAAIGAPGPQRGTLGRRVRNTFTAYGFLGPAMGLVLFFFVIPGILLVVLSLTDLSSANFSDP
ncbi:MAG: hypothetical protein E2O98_02815, partial [Acidobacteria bacterium]